MHAHPIGTDFESASLASPGSPSPSPASTPWFGLPLVVALALVWPMAAMAAEPAGASNPNKAAAVSSARATEPARRLDAGDLQQRFRKGVQLAEQKRTVEAIEVFRKLSEDYPDVLEAQNNLAVLYAERGDTEKARGALEAALRGRPSFDTVHRNLGVLSARQAAAAYARALNIDENKVAPARLALIGNVEDGIGPMPPAATAAAASNAPSATTVAMAPAPAAVPPPPPAPSPAPAPLPAPVAAPAPSPAPMPTVPPPPVPVASAQPAASPPAASRPAVAAARPATVASAPAASSAPAAPSTPSASPSPAASPKSVAAPPVTAAASTPVKTADATADDAAIRKALQAWAAAWSRQDVDAYIATYAPGFKGNESSAAAWQAARRARIAGKQRINVTLSDITLALGPGAKSATFTQSYAADQLQLVNRKTLHFESRDGRWVIVRESSAPGRS